MVQIGVSIVNAIRKERQREGLFYADAPNCVKKKISKIVIYHIKETTYIVTWDDTYCTIRFTCLPPIAISIDNF